MHTPLFAARRMETIDVSAIRKSFQLKGKCKDPIDLSIGLPHFPTPSPVIEAYRKALQDGHTAYSLTAGIPQLREAMAAHYRSQPDQILISAGIAPILWLLFLAIIEPGDRVLITDPTFLIYRSLIPFFQAEAVTIPEDFTVEDLQQISQPERIKLILLANPSNPSGCICKKEQILALIRFAKKRRNLLVIDEIYRNFTYDNDFYSLAEHLSDPDLATLLLVGFSKSHAMTGLRLGAAIGHLATIHQLEKLQQYSIVCAPTPCQYAALAALQNTTPPHWIDYYKKNRELCLQALQKHHPHIQFATPSGAFYLFLEMQNSQFQDPAQRDEKKITDNLFVQLALESEELLLVPGNIFSTRKNCIRLSYGVDRQVLARGLSALLRVVDSIGSRPWGH